MSNLYVSRKSKTGNMMAKVLQIDKKNGRVRIYIPALHGADPTLDDPEFTENNDNKDSNEETVEDTQTTDSKSETPEDPEISAQDNEEQPAQPSNDHDIEDPNKPPEESSDNKDGEELSEEEEKERKQAEKDNLKYKDYPWADVCSINLMDKALEPTFGRMFALCGEESEDEIPVLLPNKGNIGWVMFEGGDIGRPVFIGNWCHQLSMIGETWIKDMRSKYASWVASLKASASNGSGGSWNGEYYEGLPTYQLSESAIKDIATCITGETGGSDDVACRQEASQIANLNEVTYGKSNTESAIIATIHGGWYAKSSWTRGCTETAIQAVKTVLVEGKRVFPRYVTEHDTFPMDIKNAKDRSAYQKGDPVSNRYGSNYQFYCFMGSNQNGDIAGYFQKDYEKYKSDDSAKVQSNISISESGNSTIDSYLSSIGGSPAKEWGSASGTQCVELPKHYIESVFGVSTRSLALGNGNQMYYLVPQKFPNLFKSIKYTSSITICPGDIISLVGNQTQYGHAAVVKSVSGGNITILEQWAGSGTVRESTFSITAGGKRKIIGVARPIK